MTQKYYIYFIVIIYLILLISYILLDYLAFGNTGNDVVKMFQNMEKISNILYIKNILIGLLLFILLGGVIGRLRKLKMKLIWGILMFIPGINFIFAIILVFIKDKNISSEN